MREKNPKGWDRTLEHLAEGLARLWKRESDHECSDVSFFRMTYTVRLQQGSNDDPDTWPPEEHELRRDDSGCWHYSLSRNQLEERTRDRRRQLAALRAFPRQDETTRRAIHRVETSLEELTECGGWCELDAKSSNLIELAYARFRAGADG